MKPFLVIVMTLFAAGMISSNAVYAKDAPTEPVLLYLSTAEEIASAPVKVSVNNDNGAIIFQCDFLQYTSPVDIYIAFVTPDGTAYYPHSNGLLEMSLEPYLYNSFGNFSGTVGNNGHTFSYGQWQVYWLIQPTGGAWSAYEFGGYGIYLNQVADSSGVAGKWNTSITVDARECGEGIYSYNSVLSMVQNGNNITISGKDDGGNDFVLYGSINGSTVTASGSYSDGSGTTTLSGITYTFTENSFSGQASWIWRFNSKYTSGYCAGTDTFYGTKQ